MGTVRSLVIRLITLLAVAAAVIVGGPGTATAGGPTSVLLASPYADAATGLYYTDADYVRLQALLGGPDLPTGSSQPPAAAGSPYVTATWLIHDVDAWRIDRIFLVGDDVWVVSEVSGAGEPLTGDGMYPGETGNAGAIWHRAADPIALTALLSAHGLTPGSNAPAADAAPATDAGLADPGPVQPAAASPSGATPSNWLWGIGGLVAGLLAGGALVRLALARAGSTRPDPASPPEPAPMLPIR